MKTIRNFIQLTEQYGTAGQPTEDQFETIAMNDYKHVINLSLPDHPDSISSESELVTLLGMNYIHIPVPFDNPKPEHVKLFCNIMTALSDQKVFIHCIMNYRVSAFMYHYLYKVKGLNKQESTSAIFESWKPGIVWKELLDWGKSEIGL
jgi:protein tyrosine phosphatase (PTP) superfamily phosphohydrolase (DUF442 family)